MRGFIGQLDRGVGVALVSGLAIGIAWLLSTGIGVVLAGVLVPLAAILLMIQRRWLEFGAFLLGTGILPAIGYRAFGPPAQVATTSTGGIPVELFAPAVADLLVLAGVVTLAVTIGLGLREGRRRDAHEARHEERKRRRLGDHPS